MKLGVHDIDVENVTAIIGRVFLGEPSRAMVVDPNEHALREAASMKQLGAQMIEVVDAVDGTPADRLEAVERTIRATCAIGLPVSIATADSGVARAAVRGGAVLVNGGRAITASMATVAFETGVPVVVQAERPSTGSREPLTEISESLRRQLRLLEGMGMTDVWLSLDCAPPSATGPDPVLLAALPVFMALGHPIVLAIDGNDGLSGSHRRSEGRSPGAAVAISTLAAQAGVHFIATADVRAAVAAVQVVSIFGARRVGGSV